MATVDLTAETFASQIEKEGILMIDFWAPWCGPCRQFGPVYSKVSEDYPDVTFGKVNTEEEQQLAVSAGISSIPTIMGFRDGIAVFRTAGALPEAALRDILDQIKALDMDEVRQKIAEEEARQN